MALVLPSLPALHKPTATELGQLTTAITQAYGVRAVKAADNTPVNNSIVLVNDADLLWAVEANARYDFDLYLVYNSNTTADFKFGFTFPTGLTMNYTLWGFNTASSFIFGGVTNETTVNAVGGLGTDAYVIAKGTVTAGANAGTLRLQFAQNTANVSNSFTRSGSRGTLRKD